MANQLAYFTVESGSPTPGVYSYDTVATTVSLVSTSFNAGPLAITPDGSHIYSIIEPTGSPGTITAINTVLNTRTNFNLGTGKTASWLAIDPTGTYLYVVDNANFVVYQVTIATNTINATSGTILGTGSLPNLFITIAPNGNNAYISGFNGSFVQVMSLPSMTITHNISTGSSSASTIGITAVTPDSSTGYTLIVGPSFDELAIVNLTTNTLTGHIVLGTLSGARTGWGYAFDSSNLYTTIQVGASGGTIAQTTYPGNTWVANTALPEWGQGIGITSSGSELISTQQPSGSPVLVLTALPSYTQTTVSVNGNTQYLVMGSPPTTEQIVMIV